MAQGSLSLSPALALSYSLRQNLDTPRWAGARADAVSDMHSRANRRKRTSADGGRRDVFLFNSRHSDKRQV